jgi:hypothetical protein
MKATTVRFVGAMTLISCAGNEEPALSLALPASAASFPVVRNSAVDSTAEFWTTDSVALLRIGGASARGCNSLEGITTVHELPSGQLLLSSGRARTVRVFGADGSCVGTVGRHGEGPGEFASAIQVSAAGGDSVVVFEVRSAAKVSTFGVTQGFLGSTRVQLDSLARVASSSPRNLRFHELGGGVTLMRAISPQNDSLTDPTGWKQSREDATYYLLDSSLRTRSELGRWASGKDITLNVRDGGGGHVEMTTRAFRVADTRAASDPSGARTCIGDAYRPAIACFDTRGGGIVFTWIAPIKVLTDVDIDAWVADMVESTARHVAVDRVHLDTELRRIAFPSHEPFFLALYVDADLNVWVRPWPTVSTRTGVASYVVFDRNGKLLARATVPANMRPESIMSDHIFSIETDSLDVQSVVKWRLLKNPAR